MKHAFGLAGIVAWLVSNTAHAQFPAPRAIPNLPVYQSGTAEVIARGPDGSLFVYGDFISIDGTARQRVAKINSDGTLATNWTFSLDSDDLVSDMVVDATNTLFVAGDFNAPGGTSLRNIVRVDGTTGSVDTNWNPNPNFNVRDLALGPGGTLYVSGLFSTIGGQNRNSLAKLSTTGSGSADPTWNPAAPIGGLATSLAVDAAGDVFLGGNSFLNQGGASATCLAKVSGTGTGTAIAGFVAPNFCGSQQVTQLTLGAGGAVFAGLGASSNPTVSKLSGATGALDATWSLVANREVKSITAGSDGWLYLAGFVTAINGTPVNYLARVSQSSPMTVDTAWVPGTVGFIINDLVWTPGGTLDVGGDFRFIAGRDRLGIARLDVAIPTAFAPIADLQRPGFVECFVHVSDGATVFGGKFSRVGTAYRTNLFKLRPDGSVDPAWNPAANDKVERLLLDPNGNVVAAGAFTVIGGESRTGVAFLQPAGNGNSIGSLSVPTIAGGSVNAAARDGNALFIGGTFTAVGGQTRQRLAKLSFGPGGLTLDAAWTPSLDAGPFGGPSATDAVADGAGRIYIAGRFSQVSGQSRSGIARLSSSGVGSVDAGWATPALSFPIVNDITLDGSNALLAAGEFDTVGGASRMGFARFTTSTGALDPSWNAILSDSPFGYAVAVDSSGRSYLGGGFSQIGAAARENLARVDTNGTLMSDWNPGASQGRPFAEVYMVEPDARGGVYVAGNFATTGGASRAGLALLPYSDPPTVSGLGDRTIDEDSSSGPIPFTIGDAETPASALVVTASATNTALLPPGSLALAGAGANRTIALTPAANLSGTSNVTVRATDGGTTYTDVTFLLTVSEVNDLPAVTVPSSQSMSEDAGTLQLQLDVSDVETAASNIVVTATSSDLQLFPPGSIVPGSGGATRQLSITPSANRSGTAQITVTVTDANSGSTNGQFNVTVTPVPDAPIVAAPPAQAVAEDTSTGSLPFTVADADALAGSSIAVVAPTNPALLDIGDVVISYDSATGLGTLTATPKSNASGTASVSLVAEDADFLESAPAVFTLNVSPVNDLPTVSQPANIGAGFLEDSTRNVPLTVGDVETPAGSLVVVARILATNNPALFGAGGLVVTNGATPSTRTLVLAPAANQSGQATVELEVEDASQAKSQSAFTVRVTPVTDDPDLVVTVDDARATISPGATNTWTVTARNDGIDTVSGVQLVHVASSGIAIVGFTCTGANGGVCHAASGNGALGTVAVQLAPGGSVTYAVSGSVTATKGSISYSVEAKPPAGLNDTDPEDNLRTDSTEVSNTLFADGFE